MKSVGDGSANDCDSLATCWPLIADLTDCRLHQNLCNYRAIEISCRYSFVHAQKTGHNRFSSPTDQQPCCHLCKTLPRPLQHLCYCQFSQSRRGCRAVTSSVGPGLYIHAPLLLNLSNVLPKGQKMLRQPHIFSLFPNWLNKFNDT